MSGSGRRPVLVRVEDGFELTLSADERELLVSVAEQLRGALQAIGDPASPVPDTLRRLVPIAYPTDAAAQLEFEASQRSETGTHLADALETVRETANAGQLADEEAQRWLDALVELRLFYGTSLGVQETWSEPDENDPRYAEWLCYGYLTYLASEIVDALAPLLPPYDGKADEDAPDDPWGEPPGDLRWDGTPVPKDELE